MVIGFPMSSGRLGETWQPSMVMKKYKDCIKSIIDHPKKWMYPSSVQKI